MRAFVCFLFAAKLVASVPEFEPTLGQAESQFLFLGRAVKTRAFIEDRALQLGVSGEPRIRLSWVASNAEPVAEHKNWTAVEPSGSVFHYCNQPNLDLCLKA